MFGSRLVQMITGKWDHIGYATTADVTMPASSVQPADPLILPGTLPKGTWLQTFPGDDTRSELASGLAIGFTTQDITLLGQTDEHNFKMRTIGKFDLPIQIGQAVSFRLPSANARMEFEGLGAAAPGNLVCTSGTGALSTATARNTLCSFLNGCIRIAQTGDIAQLVLEEAALTPLIAGNLRIRVRMISGDKV